jgi:hypothetical protein
MNNINTTNEERLEFISHLRDAFLTTKGYGIYAYLSPIDVNNLFEKYSKTNIPARDFAKKYVSSMT